MSHQPKRIKRSRELGLRVEINKPFDYDYDNANNQPSVSVTPKVVKFCFAHNRYVTLTNYLGAELIHIREYDTSEVDGNGQYEYPTKSGVCLNAKRLKILKNCLDDIDDNLKAQQQGVTTNYKTHLGAAIYASVGTYNGVDLRRYWIPEGQENEVPTRCGIFIPASQWPSLKRKLTELLATHPHLEEVDECFHQNQLGMMDCRECNPFGGFI